LTTITLAQVFGGDVSPYLTELMETLYGVKAK